MEAVKLREFLLVVWKSQTYFGQLYVCLWLLSYLATFIGMEILHSMDNNLNCNYTFKQPNVKLVCPDYDNSPQKYRFTFAIIYGVLPFAIWFLYTAYSVPRLRKFRRHEEFRPFCGLYTAYFIQLFSKLLIHFVMLFIYVTQVQFSFPSRLHCSLMNTTDPDSKPKPISCNERYRVEKSVMQTTLTTALAVLTLIPLVELVYVLNMTRSRSRTVFVGEENNEREHLDNGCLCVCAIPTDTQFILLSLHLRKIDLPREPENQSETELEKYFEDIKTFYLEKTEYVDNLLLPDRGVLKLDDIFIKPVITDARRPKSATKNYFVQNKLAENKEDLSSTFLLTGMAGTGKTTFAHKIIRQWAKGESWLSSIIKVVLFLDFNLLKDAERTVCLRELICNQFPLEFNDFVQGNPGSTLIIIDNVGELNIEFKESDFSDTLDEEMPFSVMLEKLIIGKLLKGATVIGLTRLLYSGYTGLVGTESQAEIVGFLPQSVEEYINKYFDRADVELNTLELLNQFTDDACSICCVPFNCFYMCSLLKWPRRLDNSSVVEKRERVPESLTQLYIQLTQMISLKEEQPSCSVPTDEGWLSNCTNQCSKSPGSKNTPLGLANIDSHACSLAMRSIDEGKAFFTIDELCCVLSEEDIPVYFRPIERNNDDQETRFSFRWGCFQEFLAAYFTVCDHSLTKFQSLVEQVKEDSTGKRDQVLQFACGLLFQLPQASDKTKREAIHLVTAELDNGPQQCKRKQKELQIVLLKCVSEVKDRKLYREVASRFIPFVEFPCCDIGVPECSALANVLGASPFASIRSIDLSDNKVGVMGIRQLTQKLLLPGKGPTEEFNVKANMLGDQGIKEMTEALKKKECRLKILNVAENCITSVGVSSLSSALNLNTSIEELNLSGNDICSEGVAQLATTLRKEKTKLSKVNLGLNNIGDNGVASLESIRQSSMSLAWNNITITGIKSLASFFPSLTNLEELDLSGNVIGGVGLKVMLPCLMTPSCRIKRLELNFCKLLDAGLTHCAELLTFSSNQITVLGLAGNSITNEGVRNFAGTFDSPACKVKHLSLSRNQIGDEGVEILSQNLCSLNCTLQELDLSRNLIHSKGCKFLAAAIRRRNCLQRLDLQGNQVGDEGATDLLSSLRIHNCKLHSLTLDQNDIGDEGISRLPHAFRSPHCNLENLKLRRNLISRKSLESLTEAMNNTFCRLELALNDLA